MESTAGAATTIEETAADGADQPTGLDEGTGTEAGGEEPIYEPNGAGTEETGDDGTTEGEGDATSSTSDPPPPPPDGTDQSAETTQTADADAETDADGQTNTTVVYADEDDADDDGDVDIGPTDQTNSAQSDATASTDVDGSQTAPDPDPSAESTEDGVEGQGSDDPPGEPGPADGPSAEDESNAEGNAGDAGEQADAAEGADPAPDSQEADSTQQQSATAETTQSNGGNVGIYICNGVDCEIGDITQTNDAGASATAGGGADWEQSSDDEEGFDEAEDGETAEASDGSASATVNQENMGNLAVVTCFDADCDNPNITQTNTAHADVEGPDDGTATANSDGNHNIAVQVSVGGDTELGEVNQYTGATASVNGETTSSDGEYVSAYPAVAIESDANNTSVSVVIEDSDLGSPCGEVAEGEVCMQTWNWYLTDPDYEYDPDDVDGWNWTFGDVPDGVEATYTTVDASAAAPGTLLFNLLLQNGEAPEINYNMSLAIGCNCVWLWNWYFLFGSDSDEAAEDEDEDAASPKSVVIKVSDDDEAEEEEVESSSSNDGNEAPAISQSNIASSAAEAIATMTIGQSIDQSYGNGALGAYQSAAQAIYGEQTAMAAAQVLQHGASNYNASIGTWVDQTNIAAVAASAITEATLWQGVDQYAGGADSYHAQQVAQAIGIAQTASSSGQAAQKNVKNKNFSAGGTVVQYTGTQANGSAVAATTAIQSVVQIQDGAGSAQAQAADQGALAGQATAGAAQSAQQNLENENESTDSEVDQSLTALAEAAGIALAGSSQIVNQGAFGAGSIHTQGASQLSLIAQVASAGSQASQQNAATSNASAGASVVQAWGSQSIATSAAVAVSDQMIEQHLEGDDASAIQDGIQRSLIAQQGAASSGAAADGEAIVVSEANNLNLALIEQFAQQIVIPFLQIGEPPPKEEDGDGSDETGNGGATGQKPATITHTNFRTIGPGERTVTSATSTWMVVDSNLSTHENSSSAVPDVGAPLSAAPAEITVQSVVIATTAAAGTASAATAGAPQGGGQTTGHAPTTEVSASTDDPALATHGPPEEGPWAGDAGEAEEEAPSPPPAYAPAPSGAAASGVADGSPGGTATDTALMNVGIPAMLAWLLGLLVVRRPALYDDKPEEPG